MSDNKSNNGDYKNNTDSGEYPLDSLTDDDELALNAPPGYVHLMLWAGYVKRALQQYKMPAGKRLRLLERLNDLLAPALLAVIEPMTEVEAKMMDEALSLDRDNGCQNSFDVLTGPKVFGHFRRLNPSYMAAIKLQMTTARTAQPMPSPYTPFENRAV